MQKEKSNLVPYVLISSHLMHIKQFKVSAKGETQTI